MYFAAGGGHRSAAIALADVIRSQGRPWDVELVNLDDLLEPIDLVQKATGVRCFEFYNWALRLGWTYLPSRLLPLTHRMIRILHTRQVELLGEFWRRTSPDLVVSVVPHFGRAIFEGLGASCPKARLVTILTDLADCPPNFWIERQNQHFVCGSAKAVEQARQMGVPEAQIWRVSGMIVHPRFYQPASGRRIERLRRLGLSPELPVALVMFGGYGSNRMTQIVRRLAARATPVQLILMCGHNAGLARRLEKMETPYPKAVVGFTSDVVGYMAVSDVFIGKPGPGSVSEALATGLPVIVERSAGTMVQERYNVDWIEQHGVGVGIPGLRELPAALGHMLRPAVHARLRSNIERLQNRAVFEIPAILEQVLALGAARLSPAGGPGARTSEFRV
ncbi:MAG: galactosyldiacylglycerol synthase [Acidobacteria bacterium]|nr:galactosyldiacylglycerol synthase [Acidobacteriota bacterium]